MKTNKLNLNDAVNQQVLSKLNHRIKQKKRLSKQVDTKCSRNAKKFYKIFKFTKYLALLELIFMPFFTKPLWCVRKFTGTELSDTCGHKYEYTFDKVEEMNKDRPEDDQIVWYPSSNIIFLDPKQQAALDILAYLVLVIFTVLRLFLKRVTKTAMIRTTVLGVLLFYLIVSSILIIAIDAELKPY